MPDLSPTQHEQLVDEFLRAIAPVVRVSHTAECKLAWRRLHRADRSAPRAACACVPRTPTRPTTDEQFLSMLLRHIRTLERRACLNPELLPAVIAVAKRLDETADSVVAVTTQLNRRDKSSGLNGQEVADVIGATKQAASKRRERGMLIILRRAAAAGRQPLAEAKADAQLVKTVRTQSVTYLADFRARRAS